MLFKSRIVFLPQKAQKDKGKKQFSQCFTGAVVTNAVVGRSFVVVEGEIFFNTWSKKKLFLSVFLKEQRK
jgi:hypothetical protein